MKRLIHSLSLHHHHHHHRQHQQSIKTLITQGLYSQALRASSSSLLSPHITDQTYALFLKSGFTLDAFLATTLIHRYSNSGHFSRALHFLLDSHKPDTVAWNALISGYARFGQSEPTFHLFNKLQNSGLRPDVFTLSSVIKACDCLQQNEIAHGVCFKLGLNSSSFVVSGLVDNYSKLGNLDSAEKCFEECLGIDTVIWTAMISGYVWNGEFEKGRELFVEMRSLGMELNEFSLTSVLGALFDAREGEQIHGFSVKRGLLCSYSTHLNNAIMNMYCRCGSKLDVVKVFDEITDPDVVSWTERIGAACDGVEALELFKVLCLRGGEVNEYTVINVLSAIGGPKLLKPGKQIHSLCYKAGYLSLVAVGNAMISMYGKCRHIDDARHVFDEMVCRDTVSWNSLIGAYSENGLVSSAFAMFSQMYEFFILPNKYTLASILEAVSNSNTAKQAMQIHSHVIKVGFILDDSMVSCLLTAYGKSNGIDESKKIFDEIDKINVVHLNAMASTFVHVGCHVDALKLFQITRSLYLNVDGITFSILLKACGALTDLEHGRAIHSLALKSGFEQDSFVESAVIDVYCKCGSICDAQKAFRNISKDNLAAWNAMMMGYTQHGCYQEVFELFNEMSELGIEPDEISYLGVLISCSRAGLVNEANAYLNSMSELHGLIPHLEHYACMVELLGRVGLLKDAKMVIKQMPIHPDGQIWQILLSACNIHGNVNLGRVAARKLLELQPENDSAYVLLSNLYASAGMWDAVRNLRKEMREKIVCKEPGSSWIQVRGSMHYFFADDTSHQESNEIYMKLQWLNRHMLPLLESEQDGIYSMDF